MENNESNIKPQQTGGLKLMTVFVVVLALHVVVIGGMTTYYLLKGGNTDADLLTDKTHPSIKATPDGTLASDGTMPDASSKSATASTDSSSAPAPAPTPTPDQTASTDTSTTTTPAPTPEPTPAPVTIAQIPPAPAAPAAPAPTTVAASSTEPTASVPTGPVIEPPTTSAPTPTPAVADATTTTTESEGTPYVVKPHDSLARIAHHNHTSVAKLKAANSLNSDVLQIGQKLVIPAPAPTTATAVAATSPDASANAPISTDAAPTPAIKPVKTAMSDKTASATSELHHHLYTVVKGDTLTKIAHKFKTTASAIMTANDITDATKLSIGKKLKIPSREARSAKNTEPSGTHPAQSPSNATAATVAAKDTLQTSAKTATDAAATQGQAKAGATSAQLANIAQ